MASFSISNFLGSYNVGDRILKIFNSGSEKVGGFHVCHFQKAITEGNELWITLPEVILALDFSSEIEAKQALANLEVAMEALVVNCPLAATGALIGGTTNRIAKFTPDGVHIGNSSMIDNATTITVDAPVKFITSLFQFTDGNQGTNKILTSDPAGNASWLSISAAGGIIGSGTLNRIAKFTPTGGEIGDSLFLDNGTSVLLDAGKFIAGAQTGMVRADFGTSVEDYFAAGIDGAAYTLPHLRVERISGITPASALVSAGTIATANAAVTVTNANVDISSSTTTTISGGLGTNTIILTTGGSMSITSSGITISASSFLSINTNFTFTSSNFFISGAGTTFRYQNGTEGAGKLLTSDASGVANWSTVGSLGLVVSGGGTTNYAVKWTNGPGSVIGDATWAYNGNTYYPVTTGSDLGDATHRISTIYMSSTFNYTDHLVFSEAGTERGRWQNGQLAVGFTTPSASVHIRGVSNTNTEYGFKVDNATLATTIITTNGGYIVQGAAYNFSITFTFSIVSATSVNAPAVNQFFVQIPANYTLSQIQTLIVNTYNSLPNLLTPPMILAGPNITLSARSGLASYGNGSFYSINITPPLFNQPFTSTSGTFNGGGVIVTSLQVRNDRLVKVNGIFQYTDGSEAVGKILTSDANGIATWITSTTGITSLNTLTALTQTFATGTAGTDFNIVSSVSTHTFNIPTATAVNRGLLSPTDWIAFNSKEPAITAGATSQYWRGDKTFQTLDLDALSDVVITAPSAGQQLIYNGVNWINSSSGSVAKYATNTTFVANTPKTITHSLGTTDIEIALWDANTGEKILGATINNRTTNTVDITFTTTFGAPGIDIIVLG